MARQREKATHAVKRDVNRRIQLILPIALLECVQLNAEAKGMSVNAYIRTALYWQCEAEKDV